LPSVVPRCWQIFSASSRFAVPEKILKRSSFTKSLAPSLQTVNQKQRSLLTSPKTFFRGYSPISPNGTSELNSDLLKGSRKQELLQSEEPLRTKVLS
jgi:hypothetical protein